MDNYTNGKVGKLACIYGTIKILLQPVK